jgi:hypothetical protein
MKKCIKCGSHAFNLYAEGIDQGGFCDVHYWQGRAHRAEAQPEQEPVAWEQFYPDIGKPQLEQEPSITKEARGTLILHSGWDDLPDGTKFYITPPKRPWVGLTEDEYDEIWRMDLNNKDIMDKTIAKLKEKNAP